MIDESPSQIPGGGQASVRVNFKYKDKKMQDLTFQELQHVRELCRPESLKGCSRAYAVATTYFPSLCAMAEKYLKLSAPDRVKIGYSSNITPDGVWYIHCSDGYKEHIGQGNGARDLCQKLVSRLNGKI